MLLISVIIERLKSGGVIGSVRVAAPSGGHLSGGRGCWLALPLAFLGVGAWKTHPPRPAHHVASRHVSII